MDGHTGVVPQGAPPDRIPPTDRLTVTNTRQFARKGDAERFLDGIRGDLARGVYIDPNDGKLLFKAYAEQWRATQLHRPSTATQTEVYLRVHAYPILGHRPLGAVRRSEIQAFLKNRSEVLAPGSVEVLYRWVASIFKAAVGDRLFAVSPCDHIALPKRPRRDEVPLEVAQVERLVAAIPERYRALILFAVGTGLRPTNASPSSSAHWPRSRPPRLADPLSMPKRTTSTSASMTTCASEPASPTSNGQPRPSRPSVKRPRLGAHAHAWGAAAGRLTQHLAAYGSSGSLPEHARPPSNAQRDHQRELERELEEYRGRALNRGRRLDGPSLGR